MHEEYNTAYYFNTATKASVWEEPPEVMAEGHTCS
jgi:hypothetical protein